VTIAPPIIPGAVIGSAYTQTLTMGGGTAPYSPAITSGSLPPGLTLTGATISGMPTTAGSYTFTVRADDAYACSSERTYTLVAGTLVPPTGLSATASVSTGMSLSWNPVSGAAGYRIYRAYGYNTFSEVTTTPSTSFNDGGAQFGFMHGYYVTAYDGSGVESGRSNIDLAAFWFFDPITPGITVVSATDLFLLRSFVGQVRYFAGMTSGYPYIDGSILIGVPIKAVHLTELRTAFNEGRQELGMSTLSFTDPSPAGLTVKRIHFVEVQAGLQ